MGAKRELRTREAQTSGNYGQTNGYRSVILGVRQQRDRPRREQAGVHDPLPGIMKRP